MFLPFNIFSISYLVYPIKKTTSPVPRASYPQGRSAPISLPCASFHRPTISHRGLLAWPSLISLPCASYRGSPCHHSPAPPTEAICIVAHLHPLRRSYPPSSPRPPTSHSGWMTSAVTNLHKDGTFCLVTFS